MTTLHLKLDNISSDVDFWESERKSGKETSIAPKKFNLLKPKGKFFDGERGRTKEINDGKLLTLESKKGI